LKKGSVASFYCLLDETQDLLSWLVRISDSLELEEYGAWDIETGPCSAPREDTRFKKDDIGIKDDMLHGSSYPD
jgi:hypothetical protein